MAKERSPIATCSPVARMTSSSRSFGDSVISWASWRSRSVSPAMAETTTTTSCPALFASTIRPATRWIRPTSPTEVPPYFWTTRVTSLPPALDPHPETGNGNVPPDDNRRHPGRHPPDLHQRDERRRDQQLVGDGIQELPEGGDLFPASGNATVQPVGEDRRQENGRRRIIAGVSARNQENDQKGNQEDSNEGQRVRQIH